MLASLIWRVLLSLLVVGAWTGLGSVVNTVGALTLGPLAVDQFNNSAAGYVAMQAANGMNSATGIIIGIAALLLLLAIWLKPLKWGTHWLVYGKVTTTALLLAILAAPDPSAAYYSKTDYAEWMVILPDQSAFLIPEVGANRDTQAQFGSAEYLSANKVPMKRVQIPHTKLDNSGLWSNYYVPAARLILLDRPPFYREWSASPTKGTSHKDEGFTCESAESLSVSTAIAISAFVNEQDAAKFLYFFGAKRWFDPAKLKGDQSEDEGALIFKSVIYARSLEEIMDTVVRGRVHAALCNAMGKRKLDDLFSQKAEIMAEVLADVSASYGPRGITFDFIGLADELSYDKAIQNAINRVYIANQDAKSAIAIATSLPVMQQQADIKIKEGLAVGIAKGIPTLPSFMFIPDGWMDKITSWFRPGPLTGGGK